MSRRTRSPGVVSMRPRRREGGWVNVCNIDFTKLPDQTMTKNSENTVAGHTFWMNDVWDTSGDASLAIVNGSGLVANFSGANNKHCNFLFKGTGIAKLETGGWPPFRMAMIVSNITFATNNDMIKLVATGHPWEITQRIPMLKATYKRTSASANVYHLNQRTGGPYTTGSSANSSDIASGEPSSLLMQLFMRPETGRWEMGIIENPQYIPRLPSSSAFTTIAYGRDGRTNLNTPNEGYWDGSSNTGPYLGPSLLAKSAGGTTESCVITHLLIQKYVGGVDVG